MEMLKEDAQFLPKLTTRIYEEVNPSQVVFAVLKDSTYIIQRDAIAIK